MITSFRRRRPPTTGGRTPCGRYGRALVAVASALSALCLTLVQSPPAVAASVLSPMDATRMKLTAGDFQSRWDAISAIEASGRVTSYTGQTALTPLLDGKGRTGTRGLCHATNLNPDYKPDGFCWDTADDTSAEWTPQGLTASHDAQPGGTWLGKYVYIASWHYTGDTFARISVVDNSPGLPTTYDHVLLVDPYGAGSAANFRAVGDPNSGRTPVPGGHADGISWYGSKLFLATGHQIQVYDLRHLWRMSDNTAASVGIQGDGRSTARYHNWALPMIGVYHNGNKGDPCTDTAPCLTSLSLDRTGADGLITSEINATGGRPVVRWPLNATDALLQTDGARNHLGTVTATVAYRVPIWKVQGAATDGTHYYFSGECPAYAGSTDSDVPYCVHWAVPNQAPHVLTYAPPLTQNLSWSPSAGRLWGLNERADHTAPGKRVVFSLDPPD
ncbi:hypothetical protein [Streptosporangium pseudovulgare]|uniref:hypothetical protein n=1 Tax=Streptosporangium pseudovulgare TaxID=35765 RepID=UPI001E55B60F|nr:hypothetical protein [Streptosporangium pseudovulgare]